MKMNNLKAEKLTAIATRLSELRESGIDMVMVERVVDAIRPAPTKTPEEVPSKGETP